MKAEGGSSQLFFSPIFMKIGIWERGAGSSRHVMLTPEPMKVVFSDFLHPWGRCYVLTLSN